MAAGVTETSRQALEPFHASGLHSAMYVVPILGTLLSLVLLAGSRTVTKDVESLQEWTGNSSQSAAPAASEIDKRTI